jgi:hypothetical protein
MIGSVTWRTANEKMPYPSITRKTWRRFNSASRSPTVAFRLVAFIGGAPAAALTRSPSSIGTSAASTAAPSRGRFVGVRSSILETSSESPGAPGTSSTRAVVSFSDQRPSFSAYGYSPDSIR